MFDFDSFEQDISQLSFERVDDDLFITGHYYVQATYDIAKAASKVASHQSTASSVWGPDRLVDQCSAKVAYVQYVKGKKEGVVGISFPVEMFSEKIYSGDILHILSGAVQNDESEHKMFYLLDIDIPKTLWLQFPGPKYGHDLFKKTDSVRFGTIIKPCTGITLTDYERIVTGLVEQELLVFIKEDENLFPDFAHCPLSERVLIAKRALESSGRSDIVFAPHITASPRNLLSNIDIVAQAGLRAVMFSETYYGGMVREARDYISEKGYEMAIYAHNGGIGTRTRSINRVLLDKFSRFDGGDLRQTAPSGENCYLRPLSWQRDAVEKVLCADSPNVKPMTCVRAGGLDHGNLLLNLHQCKHDWSQYLFLMGSALNSIKADDGSYDLSRAMNGLIQLIGLFDAGVVAERPYQVYAIAKKEGLDDLASCLEQRYSTQSLKA